jgi:hypothetical protein
LEPELNRGAELEELPKGPPELNREDELPPPKLEDPKLEDLKLLPLLKLPEDLNPPPLLKLPEIAGVAIIATAPATSANFLNIFYSL